MAQIGCPSFGKGHVCVWTLLVTCRNKQIFQQIFQFFQFSIFRFPKAVSPVHRSEFRKRIYYACNHLVQQGGKAFSDDLAQRSYVTEGEATGDAQLCTCWVLNCWFLVLLMISVDDLCFLWINTANMADIFDSVLHRWLRIPQGMDKTTSIPIYLKKSSAVCVCECVCVCFFQGS